MWIARCTDRSTPVCVEIPRRDQIDEGTIGALRRELQAASSFAYPTILRVFAADLDAERPYLVDEFIEGKPWSLVLNKRHRASWRYPLWPPWVNDLVPVRSAP